MVDLFHASRGCRFDCYPCCSGYLGGREFRPRPLEKVVEELTAIDNNRLYIVDNSLSQDRGWEKQLFIEMIPLKKKWCCHPIDDDDEVLDLAAQAGACLSIRPSSISRISFAAESSVTMTTGLA